MTSQSLFCALFGYKAQIEDELLEAMLRAEKTISADRFHPALETLYHLHLVDRIFSLNLQKMAQTHRRTWVNDPPPLARSLQR
ncbi:hypothetical protein [Oryzifoliimicrobium ureilyticus]|uniref:hypothetical protein n=1 Tax=Oryzifoliimicrobium ureilyticus TaxID=3113724 RepID=UPI0030766054